MDSIWGDPWADNAKPSLPESKKDAPVELTAHEPVIPPKSLFPGGLEDEAGWGDFEQSTGLGTQNPEENGKQELGWSAVQERDPKGLTNGLTPPETPLEQTYKPEIHSPGWDKSHTLRSIPAAPLSGKQNDDISGLPLSPGWESQHFSIPSLSDVPGNIDGLHIEPASSSEKYHQLIVSGTPPRSSTSSTTKTAVSTASDAFSNFPASPVHHDNPRWEHKPSRFVPSVGSSHSLDSIRTSFDESYLQPKRIEESTLYMEKIKDLSTTDIGGMQNTVHADEEQESIEKGMPDDGKFPHGLQTVVKGPHFDTDLSLVHEIFKIENLSELHEEANDQFIDSTPTRKAWYRLTRPQTMREFNSGATTDSYVRVSWPKSHVRNETLKIATRWASEDKMNGRVILGGKLGAAIFGWDVPSDGSIAPPRPMSMINPLPQRQNSGDHHAFHQRQFSTPHASSCTNTSQVVQFGWSTSPTSHADGATASFGNMLDSRAMATASEPRSITGKQQQAVHAGGSTAGQPSLPTAIILKDMESMPSFGLGPEEKQIIDPQNSSLEDEDVDWGEMVKSPSKSSSPVIPAFSSASLVETKSSSIDEHVPITSHRRRPTPIIATSAAQSSPDSMLSPARKAAFAAARATRFHNSQPSRIEHSTVVDNGSRSSGRGPRSLTPPTSPSTGRPSNALGSSSNSGSMRSVKGVAHLAPSSFPEADLSLEAPFQPENSQIATENVSIPVQLSAMDEEHAHQILRNIPSLSFMLR